MGKEKHLEHGALWRVNLAHRLALTLGSSMAVFGKEPRCLLDKGGLITPEVWAAVMLWHSTEWCRKHEAELDQVPRSLQLDFLNNHVIPLCSLVKLSFNKNVSISSPKQRD